MITMSEGISERQVHGEIRTERPETGEIKIFKPGDRVSVIEPITGRFNESPDILPTHVGIVTAGGDKNANTIAIDFGGKIGEVYFGMNHIENIRKAD